MNDSKVNPVEAQAVPDLPVAWATKDCKECVIAAEIEHARNGPAPKGFADYMLGKYTVPLFTRPTPAAADLREALERVCSHKPRTPAQIDADWNFARAALAASPAAAAGVPTGWKQLSRAVERQSTDHRLAVQVTAHERFLKAQLEELWLLVRAASPVAPVGAPTDEPQAEHSGILDLMGQCKCAKCRQGCELATDATKQLGEPSVHLAMSTSDVPTAAPLLSSRETDRSELPREPGKGCGTLPDGGYECVCGQCPTAADDERNSTIERLRFMAENDQHLSVIGRETLVAAANLLSGGAA